MTIEGFTKLKWVECTGSQYIDTAIGNITRFNYTVKMKLSFNDLTTTRGILGTRANPSAASGYTAVCFFIPSDQGQVHSIRWDWSSGGAGGGYSPSVENNKIYELEVTGNKAVLNGVIYPYYESRAYNITPSIFIGNLNNGGTPYANGHSGNIYEVQILNSNNEVIRNYIPYLRESDNIAGFYDTINNIFYPSDGSDDFIAGGIYIQPELQQLTCYRVETSNRLPVGYKELTYVGSEQFGVTEGSHYFVDTNYSPTANTGLKIHLSNLSMHIGNDYNFLGLRSSTTTLRWMINGSYKDGKYSINYGYGSWNGSYHVNDFASQTEYEGEHIISMNYKQDGKFIVDGNEHTITTSYQNTNNLTLFLFAQHNDSDYTPPENYQYNVYSIEITEGQDVVREFIPAKEEATGRNGFYEIKQGLFYPNGNTNYNLKEGQPTGAKTLKQITPYHISENFIDDDRLPSGYKLAKYIGRNTAGPYIDLGFQQDGSYDFEIKFKYLDGEGAYGSLWVPLFGARKYISGTQTALARYCVYINKSTLQAGYNYYLEDSSSRSDAIISKGTIHTIKLVKGQYYLDGVLKPEASVSTTWGDNTTVNVWLFHCNDESWSDDRGLQAEVYEVKIWRNDVLFRHLLPVVNTQNNQYSMCDVLSGTIYSNQGTNNFYGSGYNSIEQLTIFKTYLSLPSEYQEVEWIQSDGYQYINTGIVPTTYTETYIDFLLPSIPSNITIFGGTDIAGNTGATYAILRKEANDNRYNFRVHYDGIIYCTLEANKRHVVVMNEVGTRRLIVDNNVIGTFSQSINVNIPIHIFMRNSDSTTYYENNIVRLYAIKFKDSNGILKDFVPCYRKSDNEIGMFDLIEGIFYPNQGTGSFTKGRDV